MKFTLKSRVAVAAVAAAALVAVPAAANAAAAPNPQPNGSPYAAYVLDANTADSWANANPTTPTTVPWTGSISLSPVTSDTGFNSANNFPAGTDTTSAALFLAKAGDETNPNNWIGTATQASPALTGNAVYLPTLSLSTLKQGNSATTIGSVQTTGGDYSLGVAFRTNNGLQPAAIPGVWITIHVAAGTGAFTWDAPTVAATPVAPAITGQPAAQSVNVGQAATFTAAASGTPTPTVQWQSAAPGTSTFANISGATTTTLTVSNTTAAQNGTQYRAVFTNSAGSATTNPALLTVAKTAPDAPVVGTTPNMVTIAAPAAGATSVSVPAGASNANKTLTAWTWNNGTAAVLGTVSTDASGNATVPITSLGNGTFNVGLTMPGDATQTLLAWGAVTVTGSTTANVQLSTTVTTSNKFLLQGVASSVNLGTVRRGQTTTPVALGAFTVIDDRDLLPGWTLTASATDFTNAQAGGDVVSKSALGIAPKQVGTALAGITLGTAQTAGSGTYGALFAQGAVNSTTLEAGTQFDADLTFAAPATAKAGVYNSTLTLTLASK
jgi:hypothetical protein